MCDCPVEVTMSLIKEGVPIPKNTESRHVVVGSNPAIFPDGCFEFHQKFQTNLIKPYPHKVIVPVANKQIGLELNAEETSKLSYLEIRM
jgi:hypothetical protein